jgi:hypothetical protein
MVFVDMVDSYRALPKKLRLFYRHLAINVNYSYVLKVDDDTWVNIPRVLTALVEDNVPLEDTWYGHMRCDWPVDKQPGGKWADPEYAASNYPCFGGGEAETFSRMISRTGWDTTQCTSKITKAKMSLWASGSLAAYTAGSVTTTSIT